MIFDDPELRKDNIRMAVLRAVDIGWLQPVDYGFCFSCNTEKEVFDVIADSAPTQPAKCMECFVEMSEKIFEKLVWEDFVQGH